MYKYLVINLMLSLSPNVILQSFLTFKNFIFFIRKVPLGYYGILQSIEKFKEETKNTFNHTTFNTFRVFLSSLFVSVST